MTNVVVEKHCEQREQFYCFWFEFMSESHAVAFNVTVFCVGSENEIISRLVFCRDFKSELNLISETQAA